MCIFICVMLVILNEWNRFNGVPESSGYVRGIHFAVALYYVYLASYVAT